MRITQLVLLLSLLASSTACSEAANDVDNASSSSSDSSSSSSDSVSKDSSSDSSSEDPCEKCKSLKDSSNEEEEVDEETFEKLLEGATDEEIEELMHDDDDDSDDDEKMDKFRAHSVEISKEMMQLFSTSADLAKLSYEQEVIDDPKRYQCMLNATLLESWENKVDHHAVAKIGGMNYCFGVFRGTKDGLKDWGQNLNMGVKFLYDDMNDKKCGVRKGYWKAVRGREWFSTDDYFDEFDKSLETCLAGCPECRLVLTGHSQGGAAAVVASLMYESKDPLVVTFGAPRAVWKGCKRINQDNHYRFVNVIEAKRLGVAGEVLKYDMVSMLPGLNAFKHYGHSFLLGTKDQASGYPSYTGKGNNRNRFNQCTKAHEMVKYRARIHKMLEDMEEENALSIEIDRWPDGTDCTENDECDSGRCDFEGLSLRKVCLRKKEGGKLCNLDSDCLSGYCIEPKNVIGDGKKNLRKKVGKVFKKKAGKKKFKAAKKFKKAVGNSKLGGGLAAAAKANLKKAADTLSVGVCKG